MVDGTGLENQQINVSQVRILSLPPCSDGRALKSKISYLRCESCPFRQAENRQMWRFFIFGLK